MLFALLTTVLDVFLLDVEEKDETLADIPMAPSLSLIVEEPFPAPKSILVLTAELLDLSSPDFSPELFE